MNNAKQNITDDELRAWCKENWNKKEIENCKKCPYRDECESFIERHDWTPYFG